MKMTVAPGFLRTDNRSPVMQVLFYALLSIAFAGCTNKKSSPSLATINEIHLKRGPVAMCGAPGQKFGTVDFEFSGSEKVKDDFNLAIEMLHSFEYDEAEKVFAKIIYQDPNCVMAYWGVAMCNYHPLWTPPTAAELEKGAKALEVARSIPEKSARETLYINALSSFYLDWGKADHFTRCTRFEKGMEKLCKVYPGDKEAAIFYALALDAAADPADKSFKNQKKAGAILSALYPGEPDHPGIAHYLIHTYDYPGLAILALPMARRYASIAPSSAHALHMPSHIFTRLGLWDECIRSNLASIASAQCYAGTVGIKGHWDEELHGMDYLVYAYLQKGENKLAKSQWSYLKRIDTVYPINFKEAYAFAAIPSRYLLENRLWGDAASLEIHPVNFPWKKFPWQEAIFHFTRLMGAVHTGKHNEAEAELKTLNKLHDSLTKQKDNYKANQVAIQIKVAEAWMQFEKGNQQEGITKMAKAADMEDKTEKHPVTPGEVIPARELLGDMLLQNNQPLLALAAYEENLKRNPNRFNGLYGAGLAAQRSGNEEKAGIYYRQLLASASPANSQRSEITGARSFLK